MYAKLVVLVIKILSVIVRVIQKDAEEKKAVFSRRAYFRLFLNWLLDLGSLDPVLDSSNFQIDLLAEISQSPGILFEVDGALKAKQIKADIDEYLKLS
ncbi:uncharacterized protein LOC131220598 isoform X2 [Magnolia sinica]|uniref:uncharacterized protein LOC131220598 isoform X2 n=1 Tax=Magnolia sinica TaxID=86752 RepID=UPI00265826F5|nr:uncharacterized protein LOC131220598 isoform X2 [Magnolia sinica]